MSVRVCPARGGKGWEYDLRIRWPDGSRHRERAKAPTASRSATQRWAEERERALFAAGKDGIAKAKEDAAPAAKVPTLEAFWSRVVADHYRANRQKASTIDSVESIYKNHLTELAAKRLDAIGNAEVSALKGRLGEHKPKTVNNVLSVLSRALRCAVEWGVIDRRPKVGLLKIDQGEQTWYEVAVYRQLVDAARGIGPVWIALVLLAGSAGLRRGEIRALRWTDVGSEGILRVKNATWRAVEGSTKGRRHRDIPMTTELATVLEALPRTGERVLYSLRGVPLSNRTIRNWMARCQRHAGLEANGAIHFLRHTFCSHLAAAGVPAKAIQELAGHADLKTTLRYMHLAPGDRHAAMAALTKHYEA